MRVDLLIDDCVDNVLSGGYESILYAAPWNKNIDMRNWGMLKAEGWNDVPDFVDIHYRTYLYRMGY
jgi:5'(3')-deoxyribonucleotidase